MQPVCCIMKECASESDNTSRLGGKGRRDHGGHARSSRSARCHAHTAVVAALFYFRAEYDTASFVLSSLGRARVCVRGVVALSCFTGEQVFEGIAGELDSKLAAAAATSVRGGGEGGNVVEEATVPIEGMKPGTSGLRKKVSYGGGHALTVVQVFVFWWRLVFFFFADFTRAWIRIACSLQDVCVSDLFAKLRFLPAACAKVFACRRRASAWLRDATLVM